VTNRPPGGTDYPPGEAERTLAAALTAQVATREPRIVRIDRIDLGPALEHALFTVLRQEASGAAEAPRAPVRAPSRALPFGRIARSAGTVLAGSRLRGAAQASGGVAVVASAAIHTTLAGLVADELRDRHGLPVHLVIIDRAHRSSGPFASWATLGDVLDGRWLWPLTRHAAVLQRNAARASADWGALAGERADRLRRLMESTLPRLALRSAEVDSAVARIRPSLVVAFNESGIWGRLVPAVAHARGLPALDLPHAEAADPWAAVGIGYDAVAVYGARARAVMQVAGLDEARITEVGPLRYDPLIRAVSTAPSSPSLPRRIIYASQPAGPGRAVPLSVKASTLRVAISAAAVAAPCELVIKPHPIETDTVAAEVLAEDVPPAGVAIRIERERDLHALLPGAWALVTAFSQSVYEAAIAGVPSLAINVTGVPTPVSFVREGIALGATDDASAASAFRTLLDEDRRREVVERARTGLVPHLGPMDGHAASRVAELVERLARNAQHPPLEHMDKP
jgi:hypothetical protein